MSYPPSNPAHAPIGRSVSPNPYGYSAPVARPVSRGPSPQPYGHPGAYGAPPAGYVSPTPGYGNPAPNYTNPTPGYGNPAAGGYSNPNNAYAPPTTYAAPVARPVSRGPSPAPGAYSAPSPYQGYGGNPIGRSLSRGPSPAPPGVPQPGDIRKRPSTSNFQVEKRAKSPNPYGRPTPQPQAADPYQDEQLYRDRVSDLIAAKDNQFSVTGRIPVDPAQLVLFFRAKSGITHSLDFPIDMSYDTPAPLDVLINACRPHQRSEYDNYASREGLFYPPNLPLTTSLEIANYPILDAIKNSLYPLLPAGEYLTVVKDGLDVIQAGSHIAAHSPALLRNDQRAGTIVITLPIRFRGGAMNVRDAAGRVEKFQGTGSKPGDIEWIAFRSDCDYEVEPVQKGCLITLSYGIYIKSFGPAASTIDTLITPTDSFFDALSPILNLSRGRSIGFYLNNDYDVNPAEVTANTLVPQLKGADATIYAAFKLHKLAPELHWTAGGFVWAKEQTLELFVDGEEQPQSNNPARNPRATPFGAPIGTRGAPPPARGTFGSYPGNPNDTNVNAIRARVQSSGAVSLDDAQITLLTDYKNPSAPVGRERVYFVSDEDLEKLVVNTLLVVYIP